MPAAERGLEERRVGGSDGIPAQGLEKRSELAWVVEPAAREVIPALLFEDPPVELVRP
jgi:hypothetical protein